MSFGTGSPHAQKPAPATGGPGGDGTVADDAVTVASAPTAEDDAPALRTLSPSRASDFKQCPQLFKFRSIDRIPEPTTVYQARGTTAHLALERLYDMPAAQRTPDALFDLFRTAWTELRTDDEYSELFADVDAERAWGIESMQVLANYFQLEDPSQIMPFDRELDMVEELGHMTIRGILDRIDEIPSGDLVITDYKTGKAPPERFALGAFFALKIYALLVRNRIGRTPVELRLLYLGNSVLYRVPISDSQLDGMERQLTALWTAIERALDRNHFPPRTSRLCDWCSFQSICPAFADDEATASSSAEQPVSLPALASTG